MPTGSASAAGERMLGASAWHASFVYHVLAVTSVQYVRPSMSDDGIACKVPICQCSAALYVRDHAVIFHGEHSKDPMFLLPVIREVPNDVHTFTSHECCIRPPQTAVWRHSVRVHTLDRPVMYRSVMSLGLAGARMYGHKASRTKAPACLAHRLPHAGHPRHHARHIHTHTATACPASSPPIVRPRQRATAVVGPRQPPAVPLRLPWRTALRPSGSLVDCAACADRLGVPASKGRTLWAVSEAAALRHATEAVGHAKARGGGKDAGLEAARQRRCAQRVQHVQAHLRAEQG